MCLLHRTLAWGLEQVKDLSCWAVSGPPYLKVGLLFILAMHLSMFIAPKGYSLPRNALCVCGIRLGFLQAVLGIADTTGTAFSPKVQGVVVNFLLQWKRERQYHSWLWVKYSLSYAISEEQKGLAKEVNHFPLFWINPSPIHSYSFELLGNSR